MNKSTIVLGYDRISLVSVVATSSSAMRHMMNTRYVMDMRHMVDDWVMHNDWCMPHNHGTRMYNHRTRVDNHRVCTHQHGRGRNIGGGGNVSWHDIRVNPNLA